uniref:MPN domain-containing protein n=1 Tax=Mycena chlorophos TaxID=658473 RepID=A0ABQ0MAU5_MYCCL|nr:predicted protein [Mycena chlorophos]
MRVVVEAMGLEEQAGRESILIRHAMRPATISELATFAKSSAPPTGHPLKYYLRLAENHKRTGKSLAAGAGLGPTQANPGGTHDASLDLERAFIELARAATLVVDTVPSHRDYSKELNETQKSNLSANGHDILEMLGRVRENVVARYEKWKKSPAAEAPDAGEQLPTFKAYANSNPPPPKKASEQAHLNAQRQMAEEAELWRAQREEAARRDAQEGFKQYSPASSSAYTSSASSSSSPYATSASAQAARSAALAAAAAPIPVSMQSMGGHPTTSAQPVTLPPSFASRPSYTQPQTNYPSSAGVSFPQPQHPSPTTTASSSSYPVTPASIAIPTPGPMPLRPLYEYDGESTDSEGPSGWRAKKNASYPEPPMARTGLPFAKPSAAPDLSGSFARLGLTNDSPIDGLPSSSSSITSSSYTYNPTSPTNPSVNQHLSVSYPSLARTMSTHQRTQGYLPGPSAQREGLAGPPQTPAQTQAMEAVRTAAARPGSLPPAEYSTNFAPPPQQTQTQTQPQRKPPSRSSTLDRRPSTTSTHVTEPEPESGPPRLKTVLLPQAIIGRFLSIASANTSRNLETCGLLLGREIARGGSVGSVSDLGGREGGGGGRSRYVVETLLIPKQHATSDTCTMDEEEAVLMFTESRGLITLGWIHTHPSQSCFMSSVDLHTHASFQCMLPESFAVVCAPKSTPHFGIFRLTDPPGLKTVLHCTEKQAFHPHPDLPIYTDADKGHVQMRDGAPLEIVDLRSEGERLLLSSPRPALAQQETIIVVLAEAGWMFGRQRRSRCGPSGFTVQILVLVQERIRHKAPNGSFRAYFCSLHDYRPFRQPSSPTYASKLHFGPSNGSVFLPTRTSSSSTSTESTHAWSSSASTFFSSTSASVTPVQSPSLSLASLTTFTTSFPTTITQPTTTFTSEVTSVVVAPESAVATTTFAQLGATANNPVCVGTGSDASSDGVLASVFIPSFIGLLIWALFAILRPRFRQLYALREWFVEQDLRPKPVGSGIFAFLHPPVPLIPPVPSDVSDMGKSPAGDAALFPSDEQLSQRAIWIALLIALGWALLALAGALPLYMVSLPCLANDPSPATFSGSYSTLEDLSLLRLLRAIQAHNTTLSTANLFERVVVSGAGDPENLRIRIIILTVITLVLALLPALWKIMKELRRLISYRQRWLEIRCEGKQLGWLSARKAPGFAGWGEQRLKDFIVKSGLSSGVQGATERPRRSPDRDDQPNEEEKDALQVDITNVYSICDTQRLALLIDERDEILENLEIAEARYISSFRVTTPDPSVADFEAVIPKDPKDPNRPYISHPQPLRNQSQSSTRRPRRKRSINPASGSSSLSPTSFVAPSVYYKLNRVHGISGGQFGGEGAVEAGDGQSLTERINSRIIGSRFQEVNRNSAAFGRLPLGSHVRVDQSGELGPIDEHGYLRIPDPQRFGPNGIGDDEEKEEGDWVDVFREHHPRAEETVDNGPGPSSSLSSPFRRRYASGSTGPVPTSPTAADDSQASSSKRETFPFRRRKSSAATEDVPPPHMRLQHAQPFVRPLDGVNFDDLGSVYADITQWRARLKAINSDISEAQTTGYEDIAGGVRIKGWLIIGRGLRFLNGVQIIEGMAKEDVRWDVLQNERGPLDAIVLWCLLGVAAILLMAGLTAAAGLALTTAPDVAHYLPFLKPLVNSTATIPVGLATVLAPAVAASLFITLAVAVINFSSQIRGSASVSGTQLFVFQTMFYILVGIGAIWLITVGALIYTLQAFNSDGSQTSSVADGSIYMAILALSLVFTVAIIFPGLLLLQPRRLYRVLRAQRRAVTPRQRFRALYPRTYNPAFAMGACILAIIFASTFSLIFPLVAPAVVVLLLLSLIAHRFLVGYVYARTHSQTGGLLQIWLLRRFGTLLSFQPILLGLIFLSRQFWIEGGVLIGAGFFVVIFVESYATMAMRQPGKRSLSPITQESLKSFTAAAKPSKRRTVDDELESNSLVSSARLGGHRPRGSMASVLEMMSVTLAVMPPRRPEKVTLPLKTETLDDLTATERAARTHPDAPPHLPPLSFTDHAREMASILYAPELIAPPPIIWLPNDSAGVARSEAIDLQRYHDLQVTLDVRSKDDVLKPVPRRTRKQSGSGVS